MKEEMTQDAVQENGTLVEGRNAVLEAFRSGKTIDKLYVLDGCKDGPVQTIVREARKHDTIINFVAKERLDQLSATGHHQSFPCGTLLLGDATFTSLCAKYSFQKEELSIVNFQLV